MEMANQTLQDFLPRFNARFGVPASRPGKAYRQPSTADLDGVLCFKYQRSVAPDNTIRFAGRTLQLLPGLQRRRRHYYLEGGARRVEAAQGPVEHLLAEAGVAVLNDRGEEWTADTARERRSQVRRTHPAPVAGTSGGGPFT